MSYFKKCENCYSPFLRGWGSIFNYFRILNWQINLQNFIINCIFIILFSLNYSCTNTSNQKLNVSADTTICDSYNRNVTFTNNPTRVASAAPGITEVIYALGEGNRLVGRTDYCEFPPEVKNVASIGGLEDPNFETIATINPQLVIASTHFQKDAVKRLEAIKLPVVVIQSEASFEGAYYIIGKVSQILNVPGKGDSIINKMKAEVTSILEKVKTVKSRPTVYYVIGFGKTGNFTAGGNTFISKMIEMAGGKNIAADINGWSYSLEKLIEKDPDIILIRTGNKKIFSKTASYSELKAVKTGHIYEIDDDHFEITGPRLAEGLKELYRILHL
jgi:iron complex transport system substrate-binding protein